jgi:hypothetical protein
MLTCTIPEAASVQHFLTIASKFLIQTMFSRVPITINSGRQRPAKTLAHTFQNRKDKFPTPITLAIFAESLSQMERIAMSANTHFVLNVGHYKLLTGIITSLLGMSPTKRPVANWR